MVAVSARQQSRWSSVGTSGLMIVAHTRSGRGEIGRREGRVLTRTPEYEDCKRFARAAGVPLKEVQAAALAAVVT
jgi:uncharacterized protein (DUF111 family)